MKLGGIVLKEDMALNRHKFAGADYQHGFSSSTCGHIRSDRESGRCVTRCRNPNANLAFLDQAWPSSRLVFHRERGDRSAMLFVPVRPRGTGTRIPHLGFPQMIIRPRSMSKPPGDY